MAIVERDWGQTLYRRILYTVVVAGASGFLALGTDKEANSSSVKLGSNTDSTPLPNGVVFSKVRSRNNFYEEFSKTYFKAPTQSIEAYSFEGKPYFIDNYTNLLINTESVDAIYNFFSKIDEPLKFTGEWDSKEISVVFKPYSDASEIRGRYTIFVPGKTIAPSWVPNPPDKRRAKTGTIYRDREFFSFIEVDKSGIAHFRSEDEWATLAFSTAVSAQMSGIAVEDENGNGWKSESEVSEFRAAAYNSIAVMLALSVRGETYEEYLFVARKLSQETGLPLLIFPEEDFNLVDPKGSVLIYH